MKKTATLIIDAFINLVLGILLITFPLVHDFLGVPVSNTNFYPNILGAVLTGIAIALLIEALKKEKSKYTGLGLMGAISINLCGGVALTLWLVFGGLKIPLRGQIFLWTLAFILVIISSVELIFNIRNASEDS
ncbi:MAG: hypothetical protein P8Y30_02400 [candidate division WOR-3 bacterium]